MSPEEDGGRGGGGGEGSERVGAREAEGKAEAIEADRSSAGFGSRGFRPK